jgi:hypothetical protein
MGKWETVQVNSSVALSFGIIRLKKPSTPVIYAIYKLYQVQAVWILVFASVQILASNCQTPLLSNSFQLSTEAKLLNEQTTNSNHFWNKQLHRYLFLSDSFGNNILNQQLSVRGGSTISKSNLQLKKNGKHLRRDHYYKLARAIQEKLKSDENQLTPDLNSIVEAFISLESSQQAFKGLDGVAHEAYQRTIGGKQVKATSASRQSKESDITSVLGRARRSIARISAVAEGLLTCEFCDLIEMPERHFNGLKSDNSDTVEYKSLLDKINGTLAGRQVLYNGTNIVSVGIPSNGINSSVLVLFESDYRRGSGIYHGSIDDIDSGLDSRSSKLNSNGRIIIVVSDDASNHLQHTIQVLSQKPKVLDNDTPQGRMKQEKLFVQAQLYASAVRILTTIDPFIRMYHNTTTAIHLVGRSLGGGIASIMACILNGDIPMQIDGIRDDKKSKIKSKKKKVQIKTASSIEGLGKGRTSVCTVGSPPCISPNIPTDYAVSIMFGDDIICRSSHDSINRLVKRTRRALKLSGSIFLIGKQVNWMADALSLATSNSIGSWSGDDDDTVLKLSIPGRAYLIRPRRLGGSSSIHEIGIQTEGSRDTLRAAVLWQLNEIILSSSCWKHHQLESYIHGLDRVQLRGLEDKN